MPGSDKCNWEILSMEDEENEKTARGGSEREVRFRKLNKEKHYNI